MYVVVLPEDKSKSKVLPSFLVEPLMKNPKKRGKFVEVRTANNLKLLVKPHVIK